MQAGEKIHACKLYSISLNAVQSFSNKKEQLIKQVPETIQIKIYSDESWSRSTALSLLLGHWHIILLYKCI
jgi:hypothetical protein